MYLCMDLYRTVLCFKKQRNECILCLLFNIYYISVYAGHDIKHKKHDNSDFHQIPKTKKLKLAKQETLNCATWFGDKK